MTTTEADAGELFPVPKQYIVTTEDCVIVYVAVPLVGFVKRPLESEEQYEAFVEFQENMTPVLAGTDNCALWLFASKVTVG